MAVQTHEEKRLHMGGVGPRLLAEEGLKPTPQRETPLAGHLAGDAISGGVRPHIFSVTAMLVKQRLNLTGEV